MWAHLMSATSVRVQKIMLVVPRTSMWVGGSLKMLANTYSGEVPTSPKMMPMALHSTIGSINTQDCNGMSYLNKYDS